MKVEPVPPDAAERPESTLGKGIERFSRFVVAHPRLTLAMSLLLLAVFALGLLGLTFDANSRSFFGKDNPHYRALTELEDIFGRNNNVVYIVTARDGDLFTSESLAAVAELTDRAWQTPHSTRIDSLATYQVTRAEGDEIIVEPLIDLEPAEPDFAAMRERALGTPDIENWLVSADGSVTAVAVTIQQSTPDPAQTQQVADFSRALQAEIMAAHPGIEVRMSGGVIADATFGEAGRNDMGSLIPIMLGLIVATLAVGLRSWTATFITLAVVGASVVVALGAAALFGVAINSATGGAPVIIMTLCVADCVHVITLTRQEMQRGLDRRAALIASLRFNMVAIFMTTFTDVLGFLALNFGDSPPLQELGNIVSVGVVAGFVFSVTLAPALMVLLPSSVGVRDMPGQRMMQRLSGVLIARRRTCVLLLLLLTAVFGAGLTRVVYDDDFVRYFDESYEFRRDTEYLQEKLTGLHMLHFVLPSGEAEGVARPDYLAQVDRFAEWLREQPHVVHVKSLSDIVKRLHSNLNGDDPAFETVPDRRDLIAQLLLFYELSVPFGQDLTTQVDVTRSKSKLSAVLVDVSSADIRALGGRAEAWLSENAPEIATTATGLSMAYAYLSKTNVEAMIDGTFVALLLISLTMLLVLRSWRLGILSLVPNLIPAFAALGLWGWLVGEVNLAVSVIASISFGIIVDDTTHFFAKYAHARRGGLLPEEAVRTTLNEVGFAVLLTSVVLMAGFIVLSVSGFAISVHMGQLTAITVAFGLLAEFMLVPALLLRFARGKT